MSLDALLIEEASGGMVRPGPGQEGYICVARDDLTDENLRNIQYISPDAFAANYLADIHSSAYGILTGAGAAITIASPSTPVDMNQSLTWGIVGSQWDKPASNQLRWLGAYSEFFVEYTINFTGTAGDRIQWAFTETTVATISEANPVITLDAAGYGSANLVRGVHPASPNDIFRVLVQNLTAGRNVTPTFVNLALRRQPVAASYI